MDERSYPIFGQCRVTLSGDIFGEKNIARYKRFYRAVTNADLHRTSQRDTPLAARRVVPAEDIPVVVVLENQRLNVDPAIENFAPCCCSNSSKWDLPSSPVYILQNCIKPPAH